MNTLEDLQKEKAQYEANIQELEKKLKKATFETKTLISGQKKRLKAVESDIEALKENGTSYPQQKEVHTR